MNQLDLFHIENNSESQAHFEANKEKFSRQCRIVYQALLRGERLTSMDAMVRYGIGHLPRRILDLKEHGVPVVDEFVTVRDEHGERITTHKEYYL